MRNIFWFLAVVLVLASIVNTVGCSSDSQEVISNNIRAVRMMQMLPETFGDTYYGNFHYSDIYKIRTDEQLVQLRAYLEEEGIHFIPFNLTEECQGVGGASIDGGAPSDNKDVVLYEMSISVDSQIEHYYSSGTYYYGGFTIWTGEYNQSTVLIEGTYISGDDDWVRACIDVVNGEAISMYEKTREIVDRMPDSYGLEVGFSINGEAYYYEDYGLVMYGLSSSIQGDNHVETHIYRFNSSESAQRYTQDMPNILYLSHEYENPDVTRDGVFVTVVTTSTGW